MDFYQESSNRIIEGIKTYYKLTGDGDIAELSYLDLTERLLSKKETEGYVVHVLADIKAEAEGFPSNLPQIFTHVEKTWNDIEFTQLGFKLNFNKN
ncbi:MAG: hypothetical protein ABJH98_18005 [Reichenbachiella sp.]|uniref:hypothetical protein n=1 Tax=Reichenbachiella sp. TaxID=2184521 RepID=UPI0032980147